HLQHIGGGTALDGLPPANDLAQSNDATNGCLSHFWRPFQHHKAICGKPVSRRVVGGGRHKDPRVGLGQGYRNLTSEDYVGVNGISKKVLQVAQREELRETANNLRTES